LTGILPTEVGHGTSTFTMPVTGWLLPPPGLLGLGELAMLADAPLGTAIQTSLPPLTGYTTAELSMSHLRPVWPACGPLAARARLLQAGRSLGLSAVEILDGEGRLVAFGTSRCVIIPPMGPPPAEPPPLEPVAVPDYASPDPFERPVVGAVVPQETWDRLSGLEVVQAYLKGELPPCPLTELTGLRATEAEEGATTFVMPATEWLCSPLGTIQGGTVAMLADTAQVVAVQTTCPPRTAYAPLDLKVNFLRPARPDGRDLTAHGRVVQRGRSIAVAHAEVTDVDGKRVALAVGTTMILPGRAWSLERPFVPLDESGDPPAGEPG